MLRPTIIVTWLPQLPHPQRETPPPDPAPRSHRWLRLVAPACRPRRSVRHACGAAIATRTRSQLAPPRPRRPAPRPARRRGPTARAAGAATTGGAGQVTGAGGRGTLGAGRARRDPGCRGGNGDAPWVRAGPGVGGSAAAGSDDWAGRWGRGPRRRKSELAWLGKHGQGRRGAGVLWMLPFGFHLTSFFFLVQGPP